MSRCTDSRTKISKLLILHKPAVTVFIIWVHVTVYQLLILKQRDINIQKCFYDPFRRSQLSNWNLDTIWKHTEKQTPFNSEGFFTVAQSKDRVYSPDFKWKQVLLHHKLMNEFQLKDVLRITSIHHLWALTLHSRYSSNQLEFSSLRYSWVEIYFFVSQSFILKLMPPLSLIQCSADC